MSQEHKSKPSALFRVHGPDGATSVYDAAKGEVCLVVVGLEREYCDPRGWAQRGNETTVAVAERIAGFLPKIAAHGVRVVIAHSSPNEPDLFRISKKDGSLAKVFRETASPVAPLEERLAREGHKLELLVGCNTSAWVMDDAERARKHGLSVCVFEDMTGNDEDANRHGRSLPALQTMHQEGILIANGARALEALESGKLFDLRADMPQLSSFHAKDATRALRPQNPALHCGR